MKAEISIPPGCDNSPKNRLLVELAVGLFNLGDLPDGVIFAPEIEFCSLVGERAHGSEQFATLVKAAPAPRKLEIQDLATHGKSGFVDGVAHFEDSFTQFAFKVRFTSASAKSIVQIIGYVVHST